MSFDSVKPSNPFFVTFTMILFITFQNGKMPLFSFFFGISRRFIQFSIYFNNIYYLEYFLAILVSISISFVIFNSSLGYF